MDGVTILNTITENECGEIAAIMLLIGVFAFLISVLMRIISYIGDDSNKSIILCVTFFIVSLISTVIGIILALALIYSFCKVPLKKGYSCRCCMRTKWFIKAIIFIIISPCVVLYYCMNAIFGCLDGFIPDTKLDDCKLDEPPEEKEKQKKDKFVELKDEDIEGQKK